MVNELVKLKKRIIEKEKSYDEKPSIEQSIVYFCLSILLMSLPLTITKWPNFRGGN